MRSLSADILQARARFLQSVRSFFQERDVLEIETPLLHETGTPEPFIENLLVHDPAGGPQCYLITSPEFHLKQVLVEVQRPIFQIAHVFRGGDGGSRSPVHTREFLMLEWYLPHEDEYALMQQIVDLLRYLHLQFPDCDPFTDIPVLSLKELLLEHAQCSMDRSSLEERAIALGLASADIIRQDRYDELFFRVFLHTVEPALALHPHPLFVHGYPAELAAYSVIEGNTGRRFELYWKGVELANGYFEVTDPDEQIRRFEADNALRRSIGKAERKLDQDFLAALRRGMPASSGVALGLDRLFMLFTGARRIEEVSPFD
jgi:lysyl-tRNA synthetase class 2